MFEKFTSVDAADFRQRYLNTYGFFRRDNQRTLVKLVNVDETVSFKDKDDVEYKLFPDSQNDVGFEFLPPKAAWHNTEEGGMLVTRVPARQWLRGICSRNTKIGTPLGHMVAVDFPALSMIYEKSFSFDKTLKLFKEKKVKMFSVALSDNFALSNYADSQKLWCLDQAIGSWTEDLGVYEVTLDDPELWMTETKDAFSRQGLKVLVK